MVKKVEKNTLMNVISFYDIGISVRLLERAGMNFSAT